MLREATEPDIEVIKPYIEDLNLDIYDMDYRNLYIYEYEGLIAGFGRYKTMDNYCELATIGVIEPFRKKGIGKAIVKKLLNAVPFNEIWLTTIIPDYFKKFGFEVIENSVPEQLIKKARRICKKFNKPENMSIFMKLIKIKQ